MTSMFWETLLKTLIMMKSGEKAIKILKIECLDVGNIFFWCRMERPWRMTLRPLKEWNLTGVTSRLTSWTLPKVWYSVSKANIQQGMKLTRRKKAMFSISNRLTKKLFSSRYFYQHQNIVVCWNLVACRSLFI